MDERAVELSWERMWMDGDGRFSLCNIVQCVSRKTSAVQAESSCSLCIRWRIRF